MLMKRTSDTHKQRQIKLPSLVWVVAISTVMSSVGGDMLGYSVSALGWLVPLLFALLALLKKTKNCSEFPLLIWLPWISLIIVYWSIADAPHALQRGVMMLCPIIVGIAVSSLQIGEAELESFSRLYRYITVVICVIFLVRTGIFKTGTLPNVTGLAAEAMTSNLLLTIFAVNYVYRKKKSLLWCVALSALSVIAMTRMAILVSTISLPFTLAPMRIIKRLVIFAIVGCIGLTLFHSERIQQKMFYSGGGTLKDIGSYNPDFATTGRVTMWAVLAEKIKEKPWFGHGANASEIIVSAITEGITHPHNDWLRLLYEYGYFGTGLFSLCLILQIIHALKKAKKSIGEIRILFYAGASSFISFVLFMFTDNIILYAAYFGNLQFTMLGLAYAARRNMQPRPIIRNLNSFDTVGSRNTT